MALEMTRRRGTARITGRALLLLGALALLAGCAGEGGFSMFGPKEPDVPQVPRGQYPNLSTAGPDIPRPPVLDAQGQAKMESELEALAKQTQDRGEAAAKDAP